jgi:hypothetical protein
MTQAYRDPTNSAPQRGKFASDSGEQTIVRRCGERIVPSKTRCFPEAGPYTRGAANFNGTGDFTWELPTTSGTAMQSSQKLMIRMLSQQLTLVIPERFGNLISQTRGGQTHYHHYNALGSTTELTDSAGTVTDSFHHSAFGDEVQRTGSTQTPYTWVGRTGYQQDEAERFYLQLRALAVCGYAWIPG